MTIYRQTAASIVLTNRLAPLLFGIFAWPDDDEEREIKEAGTGIFVAPRLGLSARHVGKSFEKFDPQFDALDRRKTPLDSQYQIKTVVSQFASMLYTVPRHNPEPVGEEQILWKPLTTFGSPDTDILSVRVEPRTEAARASESDQRFLEWHLLPPPVGAKVDIFGLPEQKITIKGENHEVRADVWEWAARVEKHHKFFAHGFGDFPVYELHRELPGGFSGAPVIYRGRLAGIFVGPNFVATLWPLALHEYLDEAGERQSFRDHLDSGLIPAWDWQDVRDRVFRVPCAELLAGTDIEPCMKNHVALHEPGV